MTLVICTCKHHLAASALPGKKKAHNAVCERSETSRKIEFTFVFKDGIDLHTFFLICSPLHVIMPSGTPHFWTSYRPF